MSADKIAQDQAALDAAKQKLSADQASDQSAINAAQAELTADEQADAAAQEQAAADAAAQQAAQTKDTAAPTEATQSETTTTDTTAAPVDQTPATPGADAFASMVNNEITVLNGFPQHATQVTALQELLKVSKCVSDNSLLILSSIVKFAV